MSHFKPLPFRGTSPWSQGINHLSPVHALHFGLADWVSIPAPRQLTTNSVDYVVYSRSHAFHGGNQTTKKKPDVSGIQPSIFPP